MQTRKSLHPRVHPFDTEHTLIGLAIEYTRISQALSLYYRVVSVVSLDEYLAAHILLAPCNPCVVMEVGMVYDKWKHENRAAGTKHALFKMMQFV